MTDPALQPVLVGVGQLRGGVDGWPAGVEPLDLLERAVRAALADTGSATAVTAAVDSVDVVNVMSWAYDDLPGELATRLGRTVRHAVHGEVGGDTPVRLLLDACRRLVDGQVQVAVVGGAEAGSTLLAALRTGAEPDWSRRPGGFAVPDVLARMPAEMLAYGLAMPVRAYPLYEAPLAARLGQTSDEMTAWSAWLMADASEVAVGNDAAWDAVVRAPEQVAAVSPGNRMVSTPYPLRMVAQEKVDQAAAVVLTTVGTARRLGIDSGRLVHVRGGAFGSEPEDLLDRPSLAHAPVLDEVLRRTVDGCAGGHVPEVLDLYSCFPVVPKLGLLALGLPARTRFTATGGLASFGGPGNNYSTHALVAVARAVRAGAATGLVHGNGGHLTKHCAAVLARDPLADGFVGIDGVDLPQQTPARAQRADGPGRLEAATVEHDRSGEPSAGVVVGRLADGQRFVASAREPGTLRRLSADPVGVVGAPVWVRPADDGLNVVRL